MGRNTNDMLSSPKVDHRLHILQSLFVFEIGLRVPILEQELVWAFVYCVVTSHCNQCSINIYLSQISFFRKLICLIKILNLKLLK